MSKKYITDATLKEINDYHSRLHAVIEIYNYNKRTMRVCIDNVYIKYEREHTTFLSMMAVLRSHIRRLVRSLMKLGYDPRQEEALKPLLDELLNKEVWKLYEEVGKHE